MNVYPYVSDAAWVDRTGIFANVLVPSSNVR
jgi:hypothetical protein